MQGKTDDIMILMVAAAAAAVVVDNVSLRYRHLLPDA